MQKKIVILVKHSKSCRCKEWSGVIKGEYYGNYAGGVNAQAGNHHLWYKVSCNDTQCPGEKAVHSSVLVEVDNKDPLEEVRIAVHEIHTNTLAKLLNIERYSDDSGYDFNKYCSIKNK